MMHTQVTKKWRAKWIWSGANGKDENVYYYFRKVFDLENLHKDYKLFITADTRYKLFINGTFVGRGLTQLQPLYTYYETYDLSNYLQQGKNCIAAVVYHLGNVKDSRGGFLAELVDDKNNMVTGTDASWKAARSSAWEQHTYKSETNKMDPYQEVFDARQEPEGWTTVEFDDSKWQYSNVIKNRFSLGNGATADTPPSVCPWVNLVPRDIPLMEEYPVYPQEICRIEETVDLLNRPRIEDISPLLSMVGQPVKYCKVENADNLCKEENSTTIQCSTNHLNLDFDGLYAPAIVMDFGKIITARFAVNLTGVAGGMIEIGYAERLLNGYFNISIEGENADRYIMKDGNQTFETFTWRSFRFLKIRFRSCFKPVEIHNLQAVVTTYPYEELGDFSSADDKLNSIFKICKHTIRLNSNEAIMDPWREQGGQWLGDVAFITVPAINSCFGDAALIKKFFLQCGHSQHETGLISNITNLTNNSWQNSIPDYSLWWVQGLFQYYMYTADLELIHKLYPQVLRILDAHLNYLNDNLFIENMPYWVFIDWADVDRKGISNPYNVIFYKTLESIKNLAALRNDSYTINIASQIMASMENNFHATFFDEEKGCYADASSEGKISSRISEHGNMAPIWAGLCDNELSKKIIKRVFAGDGELTFTEAQPFFTAIVLSALEKANEFDLALDIILNRWGKRMVDNGATATYEEWYTNGSWRAGSDFKPIMRSSSHAWSAFPADFLIRYLSGVEILEPGCTKVRLNPKKTSFDYNVTFPTPAGCINTECRNGKIKVSADKKINLEVLLPQNPVGFWVMRPPFRPS